jgi:hypothetical protein
VGGSVGFGGSCGGVTFSPTDSEDLLLITVPASATPGGVLTLDTCTLTTFDTELVVAAAPGGACPANQGAFNCIDANDDACGVGSRVSLPWVPGNTAAVLVTGYGTASGSYTLTWTYAIPSPTRTPGARPLCTTLLPGVSGNHLGSTTGATASNYSGSCGSVSYSAIAGENVVLLTVPASAPPRGTLVIDTCSVVGRAWDTELVVSAALPGGTCPSSTAGSFPCLTANDNAGVGCGNGLQSRVSFLANPGTTYGVLVAGNNLESGAYNLSWSYGIPTPSPSATPSKTANFAPQCFATAWSGLTGTFSATTSDGSSSVGFSGNCAGVSFSSLSGEDLLLFDIPATVAPNGVLTLETCECACRARSPGCPRA